MQRLWDLSHALDVRSKRMRVDLGVTGPQRLVVRIVGQTRDITASEIALTLGVHPSTLTGILSRLQDARVIKRTVDAKDRRRARFKLTRQGERIDRERRGTVEAAVRRALGRADRRDLVGTIRVLDVLVDELARTDDLDSA
jgi:DNA-binding MarR family transcriptional regulator